MKNIQIVDGAINCVYDIFGVCEEDFQIIFPNLNQNVEFGEDLEKRLDNSEMSEVDREEFNKRLWQCRVKKKMSKEFMGRFSISSKKSVSSILTKLTMKIKLAK